MFFGELLTIFSSSYLSILSIYFKLPIEILQSIIVLLLLVIFLLFCHFFYRHQQTINKRFSVLLLFLSSLLVQLLVVTTGGFLSPFLILIHLFTLGTSFLLDISSAIIFLIFALSVLIANVFLNPSIGQLFLEDPGSIILYSISFIAIIPLAQFLASSYHFKDTLLKLLKESTRFKEKREKSLMEGLEESVFVVNQRLAILSYNKAAVKSLRLAKNKILHQPLLEMINLKNKDNHRISNAEIVAQGITENTKAQILKSYFILTRKNHWQKITMHLEPITNSHGNVIQIIFILSNEIV